MFNIKYYDDFNQIHISRVNARELPFYKDRFWVFWIKRIS